MNDIQLIIEFEELIAALRAEQVNRTYNGAGILEFARDCTAEAARASMLGLPDEAALVMDIMDDALADHWRGCV